MSIPVNHIILIPLFMAIGVWLGWTLGARQVRQAWDRAEKRRREQEEG